MHPSVSKALFDGEVEAMRAQARFKGGGWEIVSAEFPDLVVEIPHPSGPRRRFRLRCDDWDEKPPSVMSVDGAGNELHGQPSGNHFQDWGLCAAGIREYHDLHPQDPWANHQGNLSLAGIVVRVASYYRGASA